MNQPTPKTGGLEIRRLILETLLLSPLWIKILGEETLTRPTKLGRDSEIVMSEI